MLTPADLEWIRRLPQKPDRSDVNTLRALRKRTTDSSERRLLDSFLSDTPRTDVLRAERRELESRLAVLDDGLSDDGQERARQVKSQGARRIARVKVRRGELPLLDVEDQVARKVAAQAQEQSAAARQERKAVRTRLRELKRLGV